MRIVLTVVGLSLVEEVLNKNLVNLSGQVGALPDVRPDSLRLALQRFEGNLPSLKRVRERPTSVHEDYAWQCQERPGVAYLAAIQQALWRSPLDKKMKRDYTSAELASLSLLEPQLSQGDQVWLLYSETPVGALCSAVLSEILRQPGDGSELCGPGVEVRQRMLEGVQVDDPERLKEKGLLSWALVLEAARKTACRTDDRVLLNITGGYKGLTPLAALLAFGLSEGGCPIEVFYLYEDSERLLRLPGSDLLHFDLSVFEQFAGDWQRLPAEGLPWSDHQDVLTSAFVDQVVNKRPDLFTTRESRLELTVTGQLLLAVWRVRRGDTA
ncbi:MAG: hypothetical protein QHJ81_14625 [Anaerolineae bacterium]|nr:hypothetical protein [Anaerolineae bacterium]